jgi:hypothetical protein
MKLLSNSLDQINEEELLCEIAKAFGKHIETLYMKLPEEKVMLKTFIILDKIF